MSARREAEKKAHRAMAQWGLMAVAGVVIVFTSPHAPTWLRIAVSVLSLVMAFFAGLVAIPSDGPKR